MIPKPKVSKEKVSTVKPFIFFGGPDYPMPDIHDAQAVIMPLCYENAPSYGEGSRNGAIHILEASEELEDIDEETLIPWEDWNVHTMPPLVPSNDPYEAVIQMKAAAESILGKNKFLLSLGGDHAVSIGPIMAAAGLFPNLGVLQIDAHLDMRNKWKGSRYNHACVMRRISEDCNLPIIPVGIRSFCREEYDYIRSREIQPVMAHEIDPIDYRILDEAIERLPENVYLTIDLDGLDPSVIPGTGTPVPGGLSYRQLIHLIKTVGKQKNVVAADITELVKIPGTSVSEFTAAKIASKLFIYCRNQKLKIP